VQHEQGAGDAPDFRAVREGHLVRGPDFVFCSVDDDRVVGANAVAIAVRDKFPLTPLHTLVIPRRHIDDYFDLPDSEVRAIHRLVSDMRRATSRSISHDSVQSTEPSALVKQTIPLSLVSFTSGTPWPLWSTTRVSNGFAHELLLGDAVKAGKNSRTASPAAIRMNRIMGTTFDTDHSRCSPR